MPPASPLSITGNEGLINPGADQADEEVWFHYGGSEINQRGNGEKCEDSKEDVEGEQGFEREHDLEEEQDIDEENNKGEGSKRSNKNKNKHNKTTILY